MKQIRLTTPVVPDAAPFSIGPTDSCLLMGSCFTENISTRLEAAGFDILTNPFGISYNPLSMADAVERILDGRGVGETQLVERDGLWHSWLHHGSFSRHTKEACLSACNESLSAGHAFLDACQVVMFTFGSAWHYRLQRDGSVVNNCHKVPADAFSCLNASTLSNSPVNVSRYRVAIDGIFLIKSFSHPILNNVTYLLIFRTFVPSAFITRKQEKHFCKDNKNLHK